MSVKDAYKGEILLANATSQYLQNCMEKLRESIQMIFCSFRGYFLFFSLQRVVLLSHWPEKISEVTGRGIWKYYFLIFK